MKVTIGTASAADKGSGSTSTDSSLQVLFSAVKTSMLECLLPSPSNTENATLMASRVEIEDNSQVPISFTRPTASLSRAAVPWFSRMLTSGYCAATMSSPILKPIPMANAAGSAYSSCAATSLATLRKSLTVLMLFARKKFTEFLLGCE